VTRLIHVDAGSVVSLLVQPLQEQTVASLLLMTASFDATGLVLRIYLLTLGQSA
jgi:hypothetical protein